VNDIKAVRGMHDLLPGETACWQYLEACVARVLKAYGYGEIRLPVVEKTALFRRSIGEVTDIVEKEMYSFEDRNGDSMTLRPEGTAGCARAALQHNLLGVPRRLWYSGPMFRYERPQKGRQRQFHQIGVEAFGISTPDIDAELILMTARLWRELGIEEGLELQLNTIGSSAARARFREALTAYLREHVNALDDDSRRRLDSNPLRILDSKNPETQRLLDGAPELGTYLDDESQADFARLCELLDATGVSYVVNRRLVRGLDYYNKTVFEWVTDRLGAQGTVCAGGRYDGLTGQLGGKATPAAGFAMGMERLVLLLEEFGRAAAEAPVDIYVLAVGAAAERAALVVTEQLRQKRPELCMVQHLGGGSFRSQMKKADKSGARVALIWGEDEAAANTVTVKPLREGELAQQQTLPLSELAETLAVILP